MDYAVSFGKLARTERATPGKAFRLALLGDFSGRAASGTVETGKALAARKPLKIDVDNFDQVLQRLKPKVVVDLGDEGAITVPVAELDDFAPDQLVENLEVFEQLLDLRRNLKSKGGFDRAAKEVLSWAGTEAIAPRKLRSGGGAVPTDRKLSDFARLTGRKPREEADADELIKRLIGPYVEPARDSRQDALVARVDEALSAAMRRVLHSPEFQTAEALWRSVDMLVRRIETDSSLQIVLYDISAEELAADLAASDNLEETGLYSLLVEQPKLDAGQGALSLLAGLYQWELTPPHADLLGRMAQISVAAGGPFVSAIGPDPLREKPDDWHPLVKTAWDGLRALPEAGSLGLATPRFLLRLPYGKRTEPIDAFAFEEFTRQSGLSGMLWGNPAVLVALVVAENWRRNGDTMQLGALATVNELPVYVYADEDGDQVALPCTERLFTEKVALQLAGLGVMPVVSLRGRPEVRVASFDAVGGGLLKGRWGAAPPVRSKPKAADDEETETETEAESEYGADTETEAAAEAGDTDELDALTAGMSTETPPAAETGTGTDDLDALLADLGGGDTPEPAAAAPEAPANAAEDDLDALLASLSPPEAAPAETSEETEPDLDALLASLK